MSSFTKKHNYPSQALFTKIDIFGLGYNFLIDGKNNYNTLAGAFCTLFYGIILVALFFGFGVDLYQRKRPKVFWTLKRSPIQKLNFQMKILPTLIE